MAPRSETPAAAGTAVRGTVIGDGKDNTPAPRPPQPVETLSITVRRNLFGDLPVWVSIRNADGALLKMRPGSLTSPDEFDRLVEGAKAIMRGAP